MIAPEKLTTISYVFDELSEADERYYIEAVKQQYEIRSIQIPCDDAWTFRNWDTWPHDPNEPDRNCYRLIFERVLQRAREEGLRVLLTGSMGDQLYAAGLDGIADLMVDLHPAAAAREFAFQVRKLGWRKTAELGHSRRIMRRIVDTVAPGARRFPRRRHTRAWINPDYEHHFEDRNWINRSLERHSMLLGLDIAADVARILQRSSRHQIEFRNPFRDRRLVEYILAIPAYQLLQHGIPRYILRTAMQGVLPEVIRNRYGKTSFISLYYRGIEREYEWLEAALNDQNAEWRNYFHAEWRSKVSQLAHANGIEGVLPFSCVSYDAWHHFFVLENQHCCEVLC